VKTAIVFEQKTGRRKYRPIERRYIVEYVATHFPNAERSFFNVRLGKPPQEAKKAAPHLSDKWFKVWTPYADAIVVDKEHIWVIEAKIRNPRPAIGQLIDYVRRVPDTPLLQPYLPNRSIVPLLVMPLEDPEMIRTAELYGVVVDIFMPKWVEEYLREIHVLP